MRVVSGGVVAVGKRAGGVGGGIAATAVIAVVAVGIPAPQVLLKAYPLKYIRLRLSGILAFI